MSRRDAERRPGRIRNTPRRGVAADPFLAAAMAMAIGRPQMASASIDSGDVIL
jgi:hypothetical protein